MIKVLIIEDNNDIRENIVEILSLAGYEVAEANNGKTGVELAIKDLPDIILCDIMMPVLDGYGVLYMLHKNPTTNNIPFIFITAKSERVDLRKGMEMGADDYLTKPFDDTELLNAIETRLRKKGQQQLSSKSLDELESIIPKTSGLAELNKIVSERTHRLFKKNQVIYYEGDPAIGVYLVLSGKIKSVKMVEDGRELMTGIYQTDDFLGINTVLANKAYTDTATALEDSQLCFFPKDQLESLLSIYPDVAVKFMKILSDEIRGKDAQMIQLAYQSVRKKIADAIIRLCTDEGNNCISSNISRDDLASLSGTAAETVSRILGAFKTEGLIKKSGSLLTILDLKKISAIKN